MPAPLPYRPADPIRRIDGSELAFNVRMTMQELEQLSRMADAVDLRAACHLSDAAAAVRRALTALAPEVAAAQTSSSRSFPA